MSAPFSRTTSLVLIYGLLAMMSVFFLWIPFLYLAGFDFIRMSILQGLCGEASGPYLYVVNTLSNLWQTLWTSIEQNLSKYEKIPVDILETLLEGAADLTYDELRAKLISDQPLLSPANMAWNQNVKYVMLVFFVAFVYISWKIINILAGWHSIDITELIVHTIFSFIGLATVEMLFFVYFASKYVPIDMSELYSTVVKIYEDEKSR